MAISSYISIDKMRKIVTFITASALAIMSLPLSAQKYPAGLIDKTIAVVGNEMVTISHLEQEIRIMRASGGYSDQNIRCNMLEGIMESKLFLMQARVDSLTVNQEMVNSQLNYRINSTQAALGGEENVEKYFGKPLYKLRDEWKKTMEEQSLTQQMQGTIASKIPELTPHDVKEYVKKTPVEDLPEIPIKYQLSQICIYPDREAANLAVKERLLNLRERIINGEKFSTLARLYSEDPGSASRGGELGMISKDLLWSSFSDAAMALKPGIISQIVETPDGFHIIEVLEKNGNMFNARHILMKPKYTIEDREKAFKTLDSLKTEIEAKAMTFSLAAKFYSQDPTTRTNGGQMADPSSGSSYFEIDQLKPDDYVAIKDLKEGEISEPFQSTDNEGRQNARARYIDGRTCYKIIKVDKIVPAHTASFEEDYSSLLENAKDNLAHKAIDDFIEEKIKTTYIYIDPIFKDCPFNRAGFAKIASRDFE